MFYDEEIKNVLNKLKSSNNGLTEVEANKRLNIYGKNELLENKKDSHFLLFLKEFNDPMIIILIISSIVSFIISWINHDSFTDSIIIILIVIINSFMGYIQEVKADNALESLILF